MSGRTLEPTSYAERWEQAGRPDFALTYRKLAFRVADGAPFTVAIDPQSRVISVDLV